MNDLPKTTITFHDGGTGTKTQSITEKTTEKLQANTFTKAGYTFEGWSLTESGNIAYKDNAALMRLRKAIRVLIYMLFGKLYRSKVLHMELKIVLR